MPVQEAVDNFSRHHNEAFSCSLLIDNIHVQSNTCKHILVQTLRGDVSKQDSLNDVLQNLKGILILINVFT